MSSIVPDGGVEPKLQSTDAPATTPLALRERMRRQWRGENARAELVRGFAVVVTLCAGGWFLLRGISPNAVDSRILPYPAPDVAGVLRLNLAAMGCGVYLFVVAVALASQRAWAWPLLVVGALAVGVLAIAATRIGGVLDWAGVAFALLLLLTAALPAVRHHTIPEQSI